MFSNKFKRVKKKNELTCLSTLWVKGVRVRLVYVRIVLNQYWSKTVLTISQAIIQLPLRVLVVKNRIKKKMRFYTTLQYTRRAGGKTPRKTSLSTPPAVRIITVRFPDHPSRYSPTDVRPRDRFLRLTSIPADPLRSCRRRNLSLIFPGSSVFLTGTTLRVPSENQRR